MRRKLLIISVLLCSAIILVGAQTGFAYLTYEGGCQTCHGTGFGSTLHPIHTGQSCTICHPGAAGAVPIPTSTCAGCHPNAPAPETGLCPLIDVPTHANVKPTCLACHTECAPPPTTTTTTVPATTTVPVTTTVPATTTIIPDTTTTVPPTTTTIPSAEDCFNGVDDDEDGDIDCADSDCEEVEDCEFEGKITICHKGHTITINEEALEAHERHGDTIGACDGNDEDDSKGNKKHPTKERIKGKRLFKRF